MAAWPPAPAPRRRRRWVLVLVTLLAWSPLLSVLFTAAVADALGCRVHEGFATSCPGPFGLDLGELLYTTGVMGWFLLVTGPVMLATMVAWGVILARALWRRARGGGG